MKQQSGFTLIELVIVIIILGILSATAIPKFVNLKGDARAAALEGAKAAIEGAATITFARSAIEGIEKNATGTLDDGTYVVYGYPRAYNGSAYLTSFRDVTGLSVLDWTIGVGNVSGKSLYIRFEGDSTTSTCNILYEDATSVARPTITVNGDDC